VRGRAVWGVGLPGPAEVAETFGDASERGVLKAGLQLASFLQGFREAGIGFVAIDLTGAGVPAKAVAPIFRNAELYGWRRAAVVRDESGSGCGADISLVVRDGLSAGFWNGEEPFLPPSGRSLGRTLAERSIVPTAPARHQQGRGRLRDGEHGAQGSIPRASAPQQRPSRRRTRPRAREGVLGHRSRGSRGDPPRRRW